MAHLLTGTARPPAAHPSPAVQQRCVQGISITQQSDQQLQDLLQSARTQNQQGVQNLEKASADYVDNLRGYVTGAEDTIDTSLQQEVDRLKQHTYEKS